MFQTRMKKLSLAWQKFEWDFFLNLMYIEVVFDLPVGNLGVALVKNNLKSLSEKHYREICHASWALNFVTLSYFRSSHQICSFALTQANANQRIQDHHM